MWLNYWNSILIIISKINKLKEMFGSGNVDQPNKWFLTKLLVMYSNVNIPIFAAIVSVNNTKISILDLNTKDLEQLLVLTHVFRFYFIILGCIFGFLKLKVRLQFLFHSLNACLKMN